MILNSLLSFLLLVNAEINLFTPTIINKNPIRIASVIVEVIIISAVINMPRKAMHEANNNLVW